MVYVQIETFQEFTSSVFSTLEFLRLYTEKIYS